MGFSHYQSTANPTPNTRDESYSSKRQAILRCRRTVWTKKLYFYAHLDILSLRKQRPQRQKFHTDDAKSVRNLVRSYCYCCSIAIAYERQTKDRRLQRSNVNAMNLLQKRIYRKHLSFASVRSQKNTKVNQNSARRKIKSNKFLYRYPKSNLGSYD